jgi:hypothetical protein
MASTSLIYPRYFVDKFCLRTFSDTTEAVLIRPPKRIWRHHCNCGSGFCSFNSTRPLDKDVYRGFDCRGLIETAEALPAVSMKPRTPLLPYQNIFKRIWSHIWNGCFPCISGLEQIFDEKPEDQKTRDSITRFSTLGFFIQSNHPGPWLTGSGRFSYGSVFTEIFDKQWIPRCPWNRGDQWRNSF